MSICKGKSYEFGLLFISFFDRLSICVCDLFSLIALRGEIWDLIVLVPDKCISFYFIYIIYYVSFVEL